MAVDIEAINARVREQSAFVEKLKVEAGRVIVGQEALIDRLLIGLLCSGHILIEGVPGLAKTLSVSTLASTISASFVRIQFTPDLLPADITGTEVYDPKDSSFHVRKGPIFANVVLADEVNRAPAKVQSALLEAMQERQVSIGGETFPLEEPFMVLATQNPIEQEGTYPLPEAQLDRFMLKVSVDYPSRNEEKLILERFVLDQPERVNQVATTADIIAARDAVLAVHLEERLRDYIVTSSTPRATPSRIASGTFARTSPTAHRLAPAYSSRRPPERTRLSMAAATSPPTTSRRSHRTCCAIA